MRIWTRKSASIQPRTSPGKSDGVVAHPGGAPAEALRQRLGAGWRRAAGFRGPRALGPGRREFLSIVCQFFVNVLSFFCQISAKSSKNFASNIAFFSIFQNLQDFTKFCKKSANFAKFCIFSENFQKILKIFAKFREILQNFANLLARR